MAIRNRALAWCQVSVATLALAGAFLLQPVSSAHAEETTPIPAAPSQIVNPAPTDGATTRPRPSETPVETPAEPSAPAPTVAEETVAPSSPETADVEAASAGIPVTGEIQSLWISTGSATGPLGAPTAAVTPLANGGTMQEFAGGRVYSSSTTGAHIVRLGFLSFYLSYGGETGVLGMPIGPERPAMNGGLVQDFQGGVLWYSAQTGVHMTRAGFLNFFASQGYEWGTLGYPTSSERPAKNGGSVQDFQGGVLWYSPSTGVAMTRAGFLEYYAAQGYEWGPLGFPTNSEHAAKNGSVQDFQGGTVWWTWGAGVHQTRAGFAQAYAARGYEWGWLGFPTSDEYWNGVGTVQDYQGGTMYADALGITVTPGTKALEWGYTQLGKPYATGGTGPNAYDCSGFTQAAFAAVGVSIPRTSFSQPAAGIPVPMHSLQPGDLVFSYGFGHVAIYVGDGKVINALNYGTPLSITPLYGGFNGAVRVVR